MPAQATRRLLNVDPMRPVNWQHPLTRGLEGLWLPLPHLTGGSRLYDLSAQGQHGVINDATVVNIPSYICIRPDSSSSAVDLGVIDALTGGGGKGFLGAAFVPSQATDGRTFFVVPSSNNGERLLIQQEGFNRDDDQFTVDINGENRSTSDVRLSLGGVNTVAVSIPTNNLPDSTLFINGVAAQSYDSSNPSSNTIDTAAAPAEYREVNNDPLLIIASAVLNRTITENEAGMWEHEVRRGFPSLLNRRDQSALYVSAAGAVTFTQDESATATANGQDTDLTLQQAITFPQGDSASAEASGNTADIALQAALTLSQDTEATARAQANTADIALQAAITLSQDTPATALVEGQDGDIVLVAVSLNFDQDNPATADAQADPGGLTLQQALSLSQDASAAADGQANTADILRQAAQQIQQDIAAEADAQAQITGIDAQSALVIAQDDSATADAEARVIDLRLDRGTLATLDVTMSDAFTLDIDFTD